MLQNNMQKKNVKQHLHRLRLIVTRLDQLFEVKQKKNCSNPINTSSLTTIRHKLPYNDFTLLC